MQLVVISAIAVAEAKPLSANIGFSGNDSFASEAIELIIANPSGNYISEGTGGALLSNNSAADILAFSDEISSPLILDNTFNSVGLINASEFTETGNGLLSSDRDAVSNLNRIDSINAFSNISFVREGGAQSAIEMINVGCDTSFSPIDSFISGFECSGNAVVPPKNVYDVRYRRNNIRV